MVKAAMTTHVSLTVLTLALALSASAQSGRRGNVYTPPDDPAALIFQREGELRDRLNNSQFRLRTTYVTPADGGRYERVSLLRLDKNGRLGEIKKFSSSDSVKLVRPNRYAYLGVILDPGEAGRYVLMPGSEPRQWHVSPVGEPDHGRLFSGVIWTDEQYRIVRAKGEFLPRWRGEDYAYACEVERKDGLPAAVRCDDVYPWRGANVKVKVEGVFSDFRFYGSRVAVIEEGEPGEEIEP